MIFAIVLRKHATRHRRFPLYGSPAIQRGLLKMRIAIKFIFRSRHRENERKRPAQIYGDSVIDIQGNVTNPVSGALLF